MDSPENRISALARIVFNKDVGLDVARSDEAAWDSLNHLKLVIAFESEFGVRIPVTRIETIRTLRELGQFL